MSCATPGDRDVLSQTEICTALGGLSDADFIRLRKIATIYAGSRGRDPEDLLQDAIIRALYGERKCPRNVKVVVFLANAMRSIMYSHGKSVDTTRTERGYDAMDQIAIPDDTAGVDAERELIAADLRKKRVQALFQIFEDDDDATMLMMARMDCEAMSEAAVTCGFDSTKADTVRRRIRRKVEQEYPKGLRP